MITRRQTARVKAQSQTNIDVEGGGDDDEPEPKAPPPLPAHSRGARMICPYGCNRQVAPRTVEVHRSQGCRGMNEEPFGEAERRRNYLCGVCCMEFHTRRGFMDHMNDEHDVAARVHVLEFESREMFERFFHWLESQGGANFRTRSGAKRQITGKRAMMFRCNRTGFVESNTAAERRNKEKLGPVRCGYTCTAYVQVTFHEEGNCTATFCGDHYGHDARLRVPQAVKHLIGRLVFEQDRSFGDIVRLLHCHFASLCNENVLAQRVMMIDNDEIRTIVLALKRQVENGTPLPEVEDVWDEELLDKAGIARPWIKRKNLAPGDKSIDEIAKELEWPVPSMFIAKQKAADGEYQPVVHMLLSKEAQQRAEEEDDEQEEETEAEPEIPAKTVADTNATPSTANGAAYDAAAFDLPATASTEPEPDHKPPSGVFRDNQPPAQPEPAPPKSALSVLTKLTFHPPIQSSQRARVVKAIKHELNLIRALLAVCSSVYVHFSQGNINAQSPADLIRWHTEIRKFRVRLSEVSKRRVSTVNGDGPPAKRGRMAADEELFKSCCPDGTFRSEIWK